MVGANGRWSVAARDGLVAGTVALAILGIGLAGAVRSRSVTLERRTVEDQAVLAHVATATAVDLVQIRDEVRDTAQQLAAAQRSPGFVPVDPAVTGSPLSATARRDPSVLAILDRARDSGGPVLSPPVDLDGTPRALVVAATYAPDELGALPRTSMARRQALAGWVVRPLDLAAVAAAHLPEGAVASVSDGDTTWPPGSSLPARLPAQTIEVEGRRLTIRAGDPAGVGFIAPTIILLVGSLLVAGGAGAALLTLGGRLRRAETEAADRSAQVQLIGEIAPVVQQSLELAEVLPAVAVQLTDHFGLAGVALSTGTITTGQVELFSVGRSPDPSRRAVLRPPPHLPAGDTLALALQRGGRSVAVLQLVAGRELTEPELQSLRAITELVTAAVVNAALFASQQEALRRARELDTLKTVFLGTASHELRTPVTAIGGFASLLTGSWDRFDEAQRRDFVARIGANASSLNAVVQDLLDFSLLDKGTLAVSIAELDLAELVRAVVARLAPVFPDHEISFSAAPAGPVAGDANGLERIVTNLLTNAVKFSPAGTTVSVRVGPAGDGYGAQLVVADQGPGIPVEERAQVFTRFFRGSGDAVLHTRGVGIGLSVVAEFVARLRGDISIDDAEGGGAQFTVRLPASSPELLAKEVAHAPAT
jgi:signal transduction histidine kinase